MRSALAAALHAAPLFALLAACGGDLDYTAGNGNAPDDDPSPAQLCVASACGVKEVLLTIPSAENTLFTPEGRLFVSGGTNVYEVTRDQAGWHARPLLAGTSNFTGLAQRGSVLYAASFDGQLYAAELSAEPVLQAIHTLAGMAAPNGVVVGPDGELFIVNGPLPVGALPDPKIVRLRLDPADPLRVIEQADWLAIPLGFPNGIKRRDRTLYFTDSRVLPTSLGLVRAVDIQADGSPGEPRDIGSVLSVPDELSLVGDSFLVALFATNAVALMGPDGEVISQTDNGSFSGASSVRTGRPPLFANTDLIVTEKGLLGDNSSSIGNVLSVFRPRE
jgi:hypothetical protein